MIRAEVHDDLFRTHAKFDATPWFEQASDEEIIELGRTGWAGDSPADSVAEFCESSSDVGTPDTIAEVFKATTVLDTGFEASIEEEDARRWIQANKPHLIEKIDG